MSRYVTEAQLDKIIEKATKRTIMAFLSEADKPKSSGKPKAEPKAKAKRVVKRTQMKSENDKAYKAGLKAGDDYVTRLEAGLEAAKKVA